MIGKLVGKIVDASVDFEEGTLSHVTIKLKQAVRDHNLLKVPYSWIAAVGDIVLISKPELQED
ncbi:MAG: PRC-barrel domain-containing protein [Candidatus Hodarchaeota archaeon]